MVANAIDEQEVVGLIPGLDKVLLGFFFLEFLSIKCGVKFGLEPLYDILFNTSILTPFSHDGRQKLQNATCYDPYNSSRL